MKIKILIILLLSFLTTSQIFSGSKLPTGCQYLFPEDGAICIHPSSSIIIRLDNTDPNKIVNLESLFEVRGDISGWLSGETSIASDNRTIIFDPDIDFEFGESVKVKINPRLPSGYSNTVDELEFQFRVLEEEQSQTVFPGDNVVNPVPQMQSANQAMIMPNGVSVPSDFPHVSISAYNNPSDEYIFLNNWGPPNYNIIFNTAGEPVWYWKTNDRRRDFKVQDNGWITMLVRDGYGGSGEAYIVLDENFNYIKTLRPANGYYTDEHELYMMPDSGYFMIGRRETTVDMSQYVTGGKINAIVRETCIQEFTANDELIFIWRAWDHFDIRDMELESLYGNYIRFPHMNAIYVDEDGHILLSSRHLSEISKIHRQSGEFIWRLSGQPGTDNNHFNFIDDPLNGFRNQHAILSTGTNKYLLFDNGNMHNPAVSRAVEYEIDTLNMTAKMVWEFQNDLNNNYAYYMGNAQRLANGNTHINWAVGNLLPIAVEVTPAGEKLFEMKFENGYHCYRSFRFPWLGKVSTPYLLLETQTDNLTLLFNKFGDKNVNYYKIYGGTTTNPIEVIDTSRNTLKQLTNLENGKRYYFRVTAVDNQGNESGFSNEEEIVVNIVQPGSNIITNGDFSNGLEGWTWEVSGSATADAEVEDGVCHFEIQNGGSQIYDVQLRQNNISLVKGENYTFEFDAWADATRAVEIKVGQDSSPFTNYSRIGYSAFTTIPKHYSFSFEMQESSDNNARVVINAGTSDLDIYIDNLSLKMDLPTGVDEKQQAISFYSLSQNYPNPFNPATNITYSVAKDGFVQLSVFDLLGREVATLVNKNQPAGSYRVEFNAARLPSGIYFYRLNTGAFSETKKLMLLK